MKISEIHEQNIHLLFKGRARTATFKEAIAITKKATNFRSLDYFAARYYEKFVEVGLARVPSPWSGFWRVHYRSKRQHFVFKVASKHR